MHGRSGDAWSAWKILSRQCPDCPAQPAATIQPDSVNSARSCRSATSCALTRIQFHLLDSLIDSCSEVETHLVNKNNEVFVVWVLLKHWLPRKTGGRPAEGEGERD